MKNEDKTKEQLIAELTKSHQRIAELEKSETQRRQVDEELRDSQEWYRALYGENPSMYFTVDASGKIFSINSFGAERLGYTVEELVGQPILKVIYEDDKKALMQQLTACLKEPGHIITRELRKVRRDGTVMWVKEVARAVQVPAGNTVILIVCEDITESKRAEQALAESEARYRNLVESARDVIFTISSDGTITSLNPAFEKINGLSRARWLGENFKPMVHPDDLPFAMEIHKRVLNGEMPPSFELRILSRAGVYVTAEITITPQIHNGKIVGGLGIARDITERKRAEEALRKARDELEIRVQERTAELESANKALQAEIIERIRAEKLLRESEEKYKNIVELTTDIIYTSDNEGNQTFMNNAGYSILEAASEEVIGKPWLKWIHSDDRERTIKKFKEMIERSTDVFDFENRYVSKSGRVINALHNVRVIRNGKGDIIGTQGIARDITEHKRAEERIRFQTTILSQVNDAVIAVDNDQRIIYWNNGAERLYDFKSDEVLDRPLREVVKYHWLNAGDEKTLYDSLAATGSWRGENIQVKRNGEEIHVEASISVLRDEKEASIGLIAVMRDITEHKRTEQRLRLLSEAVEAAPDGIQIVDMDGYIVFSNRAIETIYGFSPEELKGRHVNVMNTDQEFASSVIIPTIKETGRWVGELMVKHKDGSTFPVWLNACVIRDEKGEPLAMIGIIRDITERKRTEELLRESEKRYRNLIELTTDIIYLSDKEGKQIFVNDAGYRLLQATPEEVIGHTWERWIHPDDRERTFKRFREVMEQGIDLFDFENRLVSKGGRVIYVLQNVRLLRNEKGDISGTQGIARDITDRKRAEEERERWTAELARSNAELEQFAYVTSHDLQEPLRMISGFAQLLSKRYRNKLDKSADEFIVFIVDGATRLQRMIEDMLAYSRVGTRGKPFEPTDCEAVFNQALANLKVAIEQSGAAVTRSPLPAILADATQMVQLFQNLISNAIKFRREEPPRVNVSAERKGDEWVFSVKDNGIGIAPEFFGHLFQLFQRQHVTSEYPGTGIGLAISKKIIERHGGRIWVESEVGKGSIFYFTIPVIRG